MIPFILLAAGRSERMGRPKGLLEHRGGAWLADQVEAIRVQGACVVLVVGAEAEAYASLAQTLGLEVRTNPAPESGPFSSLRIGLQGLSGPVFVGPIDVPVAPILRKLEAALGNAAAVVPAHHGRGGHPVLMGPSFVQELKELNINDPESRLDVQLRKAGALRLEIADPRILQNLNTPEAWAAFCESNPHP